MSASKVAKFDSAFRALGEGTGSFSPPPYYTGPCVRVVILTGSLRGDILPYACRKVTALEIEKNDAGALAQSVYSLLRSDLDGAA